MKQTITRMAATLGAVMLLGASLALASPAGSAHAFPIGCTLGYPAVRTTTSIATPYGASPNSSDVITVKVLNTNATTNCYGATVTITPRAGMGFAEIVGTTGGWDCWGPGPGVAGDTICTNPILAKASAHTIRVRYDRIAQAVVSGTASSYLSFDGYCSVAGGILTRSVC